MKKFIPYITLIVAIAVSSGCKKDFLEEDPYGNRVSETTYYSTDSECKNAVIACYQGIEYDDWWQTQFWRTLAGEAASDNLWVGNTYQNHATYDAVTQYTLNGENDRLEAMWIMTYKSIYRINKTITSIEPAPITASLKTQLLGELKFLRSFMYFDMVRSFGGVPLLLKPLEYTENTYTRSSVADCYKQIKQDLNDAIAVLPVKSQYTGVEKFRISKGAAQALLAKVSLYTESWADAQKLAKDVISSGEYQLESDYGKLWDVTNRNGVESVFEIQYQFSNQYNSLGNRFWVVINAGSQGGWGFFTPTSDLENAFTSESDTIRRRWTIMKNGEPVIGDAANPSFNGNPYPGGSSSKSARFCRKFYMPQALRPVPGIDRVQANHMLLRLGDVYLILAEAAFNAGNEAEALSALQTVRNRVKLSTNMGLSGDALRNAIWKERRLELATEGERTYDLRRWKLNGQPYINSIMGPGGSFVLYNTKTSTDIYETKNPVEPQDKGIAFNPATHLLWPIPTKEIIASEGRITQNPGY